MTEQGFYTPSYPYYTQMYTMPARANNAPVNITINAAQPQQSGAYPYYYPYPYPYCYPQPVPYYVPIQHYQQQQQQAAPIQNPIPSQGIDQTKPPELPKPEEAKKEESKNEEPKKDVKPLSAEELNHLKSDLTTGDKDARQHAIAKTINLLNEDRENRAKDPRIVGLINMASHPNQPKSVREVAEIAATGLRDYNNGVPGQKLDVVAK